MNNQPCPVRPTFIELNLDDFHYYIFIISMNKCNESCNPAEDPFGRISVLNKMEGVKQKVFNSTKG